MLVTAAESVGTDTDKRGGGCRDVPDKYVPHRIGVVGDKIIGVAFKCDDMPSSLMTGL
jgi:hypothetical protein